MLNEVYRSLAEFAGLGKPARDDIIVRRQFPTALETGVYFSLPRAGKENEQLSELVIGKFGVDAIRRVPGFTFHCKTCEGRGIASGGVCRLCDGLGQTRPRFRSVRGDRYDYALIACDEDGLAFWGYSRRLPFNPERGNAKYVLLSSGRLDEPSVAGLPKYHIAGRRFPVDEVVITEGVLKAEIVAWKLRQRVIGLYSTSVDHASLQAILSVIERWDT